MTTLTVAEAKARAAQAKAKAKAAEANEKSAPTIAELKTSLDKAKQKIQDLQAEVEMWKRVAADRMEEIERVQESLKIHERTARTAGWI